MIKRKTPCIKKFIKKTEEGNRNTNIFLALNHYRRFHPNITIDTLKDVADGLNNILNTPLSSKELMQITQHVLKTNYHSSCKKFHEYCTKCYYKEPFNQINELWRVIDKNNHIKSFISYSIRDGDEYCLWDIVDTRGLGDEEVKCVRLLRQDKGLDPYIDRVLVNGGFPVGDEALELYLDYLKR